MRSSLFFTLSAASLITAATIPSQPKAQSLTSEDLVLYGADGRVEVVKKSQFEHLQKRTDLLVPITKGKANCSGMSITEFDKENFYDWDVPMSALVTNETVEREISIGNNFTLSNNFVSELQSEYVQEFLEDTHQIDFSQTWTTVANDQFTFTVPEGQFGMVVSNPYTTRYSGRVHAGCKISTYQANIYQEDDSNAGLDWVVGTISICISETLPLNRCLGVGALASTTEIPSPISADLTIDFK